MGADSYYALKRAALAAKPRSTPPTEVPRDRYGRPLIIPPGGGEPVPYTRVSTLAKTLDDQTLLTAWKQRKTAEGLVRRPDLLTRIAGTLANGDPDSDWPTKRALNAVCREALEAAGASKGASSGTGLHSLTEAIDRGEEPLFVPPGDASRLDAYRAATADYTAVDAETFVVCDELGAAGTFDRLWLCPDGKLRIGDLKTGKSEADYPGSTATQLALYVQSLRYDPATGERALLHPDLDLTTGLLIHMPATTGGCTVIPLDLDAGWADAQLAVQVLASRKRTAADWKRAD